MVVATCVTTKTCSNLCVVGMAGVGWGVGNVWGGRCVGGWSLTGLHGGGGHTQPVVVVCVAVRGACNAFAYVCVVTRQCANCEM